MTLIQFAASLKDLNGDDATEIDPKGLPEEVHRNLLDVLRAVGAAAQFTSALEPLVKPRRKISLGDLACRALGAPPAPGQVLDVKAQVTRYKLIERIMVAERGCEPLEISPEEQTMLRDAVAKAGFAVFMAGQAIMLLDPPVPPAAPPEAKPAETTAAT